MPVFIRDYTDDEAVVIMVDSNIQREDILPSEKARAYLMKYGAMQHRGRKTGESTLETIGEPAGESGKTVQRYIRLANLVDGLLEMVDNRKLGFIPAVDISYLTKEQQMWIFDILQSGDCTVSKGQAASLKSYAKSGELTPVVAKLVLQKKKEKEQKVTIKADKIRHYFPEDYSKEDMEAVILELLDEWKRKQKED